MKCNLKSMATLAAALLAALAVAYFAFPAAQAAIVASVPILLALICPVMMIGMMWTRRGHATGANDAAPKAEVPPARLTLDGVQEA
jgi:MFS superfamily sulfate permease-like transporter